MENGRMDERFVHMSAHGIFTFIMFYILNLWSSCKTSEISYNIMFIIML